MIVVHCSEKSDSECKDEARAVAVMWVENQVAAEQLCRALAEWQSQSHALGKVVDLRELCEDLLSVCFCYADTRVADGHLHGVRIWLATSQRYRPMLCELVGIVEQLGENASYLLLVRVDGKGVGQGALETEFHRMRTGQLGRTDNVPAQTVTAEFALLDRLFVITGRGGYQHSVVVFACSNALITLSHQVSNSGSSVCSSG